MRHTATLLALALLLATAGCAGSSNQTESDDTKATASSSDQAKSSDSSDSSDTSDTSDSSDAKPDHPVVKLEELIGKEIQDTMPQGCPGKWQKMKGRKFRGDLYACDGFHAPHRYKEPTLIVGIEEGKIRRVNLQAFYEPGKEIEKMYRSETDAYQSRCDRIGGAGSRMRLQCDGYLVALRMQRNGGLLNIVYALKNWDLEY